MRLAFAFGCLSGIALSQGIITTVVGTDTVFQDNGLPATQARIGRSEGILVAPDGTVYFSDFDNLQIFKVGADGIIRVVAGNGIRGFSGDGGPATGASLNLPLRLALDPAGNLYFVDSNNGRIRKVTPAGIISTVAGNGSFTFAGDGGPATSAALTAPRGLAFDRAGNLYIAEINGHRIRKVGTDGIISTIAGTGQAGSTGDGGPATAALLSSPRAVAVDSNGDIFILETGGVSRIRKIAAADGRISIFSTTAGLGLQIAPNGVLYSAAGHRIQTLAASGTATTVAGTGVQDFSGDGGAATAATLNGPLDVSPAPDGGFYFADSGNFRIRRVSPSGVISTLAGNGNYRVAPDGTPGTAVPLSFPWGLSFDAAGNLLITEQGLHRVRKLAPDGTVSTIAGTGRQGPNRGGVQATQASLNGPTVSAADAAGNVYIADSSNAQVRKVDTAGVITRFAGGGTSAAENIPATTAQLGQLHGLFVTPDGVVYLSDISNHKVRRVAKDGTITTIAGTGTAGFDAETVATQAKVSFPKGITLDSQGNLYFCDFSNNRVRRVTTDGRISTIAGNGVNAAPVSGGQATATPLPLPWDVKLDANGNVFVATNTRVVRIDANGVLTIVAGNGGAVTPFRGDGGLATAAPLSLVQGLALDAAGNLFLSDSDNSRVRAILTTPPTFNVSPTSLSFTAPAGGNPVVPQAVSISTSTPGLLFTVTANLPPWLLAAPQLGSLPSSTYVAAVPGPLPPGTYTHLLTINAPAAVPATRTVAVTFTVTAAAPTKLLVAETELSFAFGAQSNASTRNISIANAGGGPLAFTASAATTSGGAWLSVTPASGSATGVPVPLTVRANPGSLAPGVYLGAVTILTPATNERAVIAVTMTINAQRQSIQLSQSGLTFTAVAQGGFVLPQSFSVLNTGQGVMNWTATPFTLSGGAWLAVTPASGATDAASTLVPAVQVSVNARTLAAGSYYGRVVVAATAADNTPQMVSVVLNVLPAGTNPGPQVQPAALIFTGAAGGSAPSSQNILLGNPAARSLNYVSGRLTLDGADWFFVAPPSGSVPTDQAATIVVQPDIDNLTAGVRRGVLTLLFTDGSTRTVNILLVLTAGGAGSKAETDPASRTAGCTPSQLLPLVSSVLQDFNIPAAWPTAVSTKVVDDCGNLMTSGSVTASFSNGDPPLSLFSLKDGTWSATWQPRNTNATQATISIAAQIPEQNLQGSISISGSLQKNPDPPQVNAGGVVSAASFGQVGVIAPGSFISIYGTRFADGLNIAPRFPWTTELVGTEVILGGRSLPLYFTSGGQINAVVPIDTPPNSRQQLIVRRGFTYTVPESVSIAAAQPAVFTPSQTGKGQGYVLVSAAGIETLADSKNPAKAGDAVVIYCAGLGVTSPAVADGAPASTTVLSPTVNPVILNIGGKDVNPFFAGLAPGFIGLYQVNAFLPAGIAAGDAVPVILRVGGQSSPEVTMSVR